MSKVNRGKQFEHQIKLGFERIPNVSIDRINDQMSGFKGSTNVSDFVVYKYPYEYYIECKSHYGNTLPFSCITQNQWQGMLEKSKIYGAFAGVMCWFIDHDITVFIPIDVLEKLKQSGCKSFHVKHHLDKAFIINGSKRRILFNYNMAEFFKEIENL